MQTARSFVQTNYRQKVLCQDKLQRKTLKFDRSLSVKTKYCENPLGDSLIERMCMFTVPFRGLKAVLVSLRVLSLKRSTVGTFVVPFGVWNRKNMSTKQDLGTSQRFFSKFPTITLILFILESPLPSPWKTLQFDRSMSIKTNYCNSSSEWMICQPIFIHGQIIRR